MTITVVVEARIPSSFSLWECQSKADMLSLVKDIKADIANISEKSSICDDTYCYGYRDKLASDYKTEVLEVIDKKISDLENNE